MTHHKLFLPEEYIQLKEKLRFTQAMRNQAYACKSPDAALFDELLTDCTLKLHEMENTRPVFHKRQHNTTAV